MVHRVEYCLQIHTLPGEAANGVPCCIARAASNSVMVSKGMGSCGSLADGFWLGGSRACAARSVLSVWCTKWSARWPRHVAAAVRVSQVLLASSSDTCGARVQSWLA